MIVLWTSGINQAPNFSRRSTHLLCPSGTGAKFDKAQEWSIPVVNMQWLVDMSTKGIIHPVAEYRVCGPPGDGGPTGVPQQGNKPALEFKMADITNSTNQFGIEHVFGSLTTRWLALQVVTVKVHHNRRALFSVGNHQKNTIPAIFLTTTPALYDLLRRHQMNLPRPHTVLRSPILNRALSMLLAPTHPSTPPTSVKSCPRQNLHHR